MNHNGGPCALCLQIHPPTEMCKRENLMRVNRVLVNELGRSNAATIKAVQLSKEASQTAKELQNVIKLAGDEIERLLAVEEEGKNLCTFVENMRRDKILNSDLSLQLVTDFRKALDGTKKLSTQTPPNENKDV